MPINNFIVSSLPAYVEENRDILLKNFGLVGSGTRSRIGLQTGVKYKENLNFLEIDPELQDGLNCELTPAGDVTLTDRELVTAWIEVLMAICPKKLVGKWAEYLVRANANAESLPFEQYIVDGLIAELNKKIEVLIWQGDTTSANTDLKWIDGLGIIFTTDGTAVTSSAATLYAKLLDLYVGLDDVTLSKGAEIYISPANYRTLLMELVAANLYHYPAAENGTYPKEIFLPGTDVKVVFTEGLTGVDGYAFATFPDNIRYGCDFENDQEDIAIKYDSIKELFYVKALWNSGVQIAFPSYSYYMAL